MRSRHPDDYTFLGDCRVCWSGCAYAVDCLLKIELEFHAACLRAIRISAVILAIRSIESVFVGALRAFERD